MGSGRIRRISPTHHHCYPTASIILSSLPPALHPQAYLTGPKDILSDLKLPSGFFFAVATAPCQVEGAVKDEGKGPNHWDWAAHIPGVVWDNTTADVVDLHYYLYKTSLVLQRWESTPIHFPSPGPESTPSEQPTRLLAKPGLNVMLMVRRSIIILLEIQAHILFTASNSIAFASQYNPGGHTAFTFNEPSPFCSEYSWAPFNATLAPGVNSSTVEYYCAYHVLKAHTGAVKAFREMNITGEIAFKNDDYVGTPWCEGNAEDIAAVERHVAFQIGIFSDPVYTTGDWPQIVEDTLPPDFLPRFTEEEQKDLLSGSPVGLCGILRYRRIQDIFNAAPLNGLDACVNNTAHPNWPTCNIQVAYDSMPDSGWAVGPALDPQTSHWLFATPQWFRHAMKEIHTRWPTNKIRCFRSLA
ncbi:hypothetical protein BT96DRAFT_1027005 [Gymnopus androsaceus JB14]|uniref:Uncharacterized protein n=1 Tax=Gymnopus androsaceus JB14 TaxID=1447944 RepID=A0A6A4GF27_9AGAR|nr:hypothetical protein BT96DRAFT_1027005 [Gymnopus androsaceus JB14]